MTDPVTLQLELLLYLVGAINKQSELMTEIPPDVAAKAIMQHSHKAQLMQALEFVRRGNQVFEATP